MRTFATVLLLLFFAYPSAATAEDGQPDWLEGATFRGGQAGQPDALAWWESFDDPALSELVEVGIRGNRDVAVAGSRALAADARVGSSASQLWPTLTFDVAGNVSPSSSLGFQMGGLPSAPGEELPVATLSGSALVNLRYQIDLWGAKTLSWRSAQRSAEAASSDADAVAASVSVRIGGAYFDAVAATEQITILEQQVELNEGLLEVLELRHLQAAASASEVLQQRQQLAAAQSRIPAARGLLRSARQRLAVLTGSPGVDELSLSLAEHLPELPPSSVTGEPADLLRSRPDLRAAAARSDAARQLRRSSDRSALPTFGISAQGGGQMFVSDEFSGQGTWGVGVDLSIPLFRGLSEFAARREARANESEARHALEGLLIQAISDVESAIAQEEEGLEQLEAEQHQLDAARQAYEASRDSLLTGVGSYLAVLTALITFEQAELTVLGTERAVLGSRLALFDALGGPWASGLAVEARRGER